MHNIVMKVADLAKVSGLCKSRNEALQLIKQGGLYIDGERVETHNMFVVIEEPMVLRKGKKTYLRVVFTKEYLNWCNENCKSIYYEEY